MGRLWRLSFAVLGGLFLVACLCCEAQAQGPLYPQPTDRFGVDVTERFGLITDYDVASLHIGWYSDWSVSLSPLRPAGIEYAQLVRVPNGTIVPPLSQLGPIVDSNPGSLWMVGNEPECIFQDNCTPEQYAAAYRELYAFIKSRDPTARVAAGGVVQPTPLRLKWLDRVLDYYQSNYGEPMPVDVWNIHNMILQEKQGKWGCDIPKGLTETVGMEYGVQDNDNSEYFRQHIVDFRRWMRDRGQRGRPLIISEYGVLMPLEYGFTPERVNVFMNATFDYLLAARDEATGYPADENRLVQRWLWCSLNDQPHNFQTREGYNGALYDYRYPVYPGVITPIGINFRQYTTALAEPYMCFFPWVSWTGRDEVGTAPSPGVGSHAPGSDSAQGNAASEARLAVPRIDLSGG